MPDEMQNLNARWMYGILIFIVAFILINFICYGTPTIYHNVTEYEIVYDSVVVRVETGINSLETMAFGPEDVRFTDNEAKVGVYKCLFIDDRFVYLPKDEYNEYREMLFSD